MGRQSTARRVTRYRIEGRTLIIDLGARRRVLSSAPRGGGLGRARYILNHQVRANPIGAPSGGPSLPWGDPARYLGRVAKGLGLRQDYVGLMTAVSLKQVVVLRQERAGFWLEGFFTVGVSNAVRAGEPATVSKPDGARPTPGTINIILLTNARLAASALVEAVQVATESKTAALLAAEVRSWTGRPGATGTGTDAIVVASGEGPALRHCGTHTEMGELIARVVSRGVREGLVRSKRWSRREATRRRGRRYRVCSLR
jgi:adenosylcobinamide amidohydrolase